MDAQDEDNPFTNLETTVDVTEEIQDWRFLSNVEKDQGTYTIPKRGQKDFEPDGTNKQHSALDLSRKAMFDALSVERLISAKHVIIATWNAQKGMSCVEKAHGPLFKTMGTADSQNRMWLLPEETLYLVERGSMECWSEEGLPMSLQAVYSASIPLCGSLENYLVYAHLRRCGFSVIRSNLVPVKEDEYRCDSKIMNFKDLLFLGLGKASQILQTFNFRKLAFPFSKRRRQSILLHDTFYTYEEVYHDLQIVRGYVPIACNLITSSDSLFQITFHAYKPSASFKKSALSEPDFRICVVSSQDTLLPTIFEIDALFSSIPLRQNMPQHMFQRLKEGYRNIIIAIVDYGVISYIRLSDVCFEEKVYTDFSKKGSKRKRASKKFQQLV
ncbi:putative tRNA-splicing endonuclease subunit sen54 [Schizosaccharomyces pombe]